MKLFLPTLLRVFPDFNKKPYTFEDGLEIARRERIKVTIVNSDPDIFGYFCIRRTPKRIKKFIVINEKLDLIDRTYVLLHELAHYFLHVPISARQWFYCRRVAKHCESKHEYEASSVALILMIPYRLLVEFRSTPFTEFSTAEMKYCVKRQRLNEQEQI